MKIYIHTSGRPHKQTTLRGFSKKLLEDTVLVVQAKQFTDHEHRYGKRCEVVALPDHITKLSPTRQWILENAETNEFVMLDDDLTFSYRLPGTGVKLHKANEQVIESMFADMEELLKGGYAHVGISAREGNNHVDAGVKTVGRMMRILGYNKATVFEEQCRLDRVETKQDFDMTLQLLRKGWPNAIIYSYAHNQPGSNNAGGCSIYRTPEVMARCSHELAALHPDFVTVVEKETKSSWGGGTRTDVRIAWKKAYESYQRP